MFAPLFCALRPFKSRKSKKKNIQTDVFLFVGEARPECILCKTSCRFFPCPIYDRPRPESQNDFRGVYVSCYAAHRKRCKGDQILIGLISGRLGSFKDYFMQVKEAHELNKKICGNCYNYQYDGFVFVDEMGERMKSNYLTCSFPKFLKKHGLKKCAFTIFAIATRPYFLQTVCPSSIFRNGLGTGIFLRQQIFMRIWITAQKSLLHKQWKADCNYLKQVASQAVGAVKFQIRVCKKCCRLWPLVLIKAKRKKPEIGLITGFFDGGELGIRTLGTFLYTTFRVSHLRPLGQLSVYFLNCSFLIQKRFGENYRREQEKIFDFNVSKSPINQEFQGDKNA